MANRRNPVGRVGTPRERLERRLQRQDSGCLIWTGYVNEDGYGQIGYYGKVIGAHRLAWILDNGPIPGGQEILHSCDNPPCCEPTHLRPGTHTDNIADMNAKGRNGMSIKTVCPQGHAYDEVNTRLNGVGARECRACRNAACRAYYYKSRIA